VATAGSLSVQRPSVYNHGLPESLVACPFLIGAVFMDSPEYDPLYLEGIAHFNTCDFFESHEKWEELWTENFGPSRKFLQGLIQAAVALHHFGNGNIRGAKKLYYSSRGYLEHYRPKYQGLDLDKFFVEMEQCFAEIIRSEEEYPQIEIVGDLIPEIHLDPPPPAN
jgi:predicted metal-dependent hydrolase